MMAHTTSAKRVTQVRESHTTSISFATSGLDFAAIYRAGRTGETYRPPHRDFGDIRLTVTDTYYTLPTAVTPPPTHAPRGLLLREITIPEAPGAETPARAAFLLECPLVQGGFIKISARDSTYVVAASYARGAADHALISGLAVDAHPKSPLRVIAETFDPIDKRARRVSHLPGKNSACWESTPSEWRLLGAMELMLRPLYRLIGLARSAPVDSEVIEQTAAIASSAVDLLWKSVLFPLSRRALDLTASPTLSTPSRFIDPDIFGEGATGDLGRVTNMRLAIHRHWRAS